MKSDQIFMQRCLELATNGLGYVAPNPMVGCVIVHRGEIIGEGFHQIFGGPHAEVHAIASVTDQKMLSDSTLYVNLEPCAHHGKTPPCANLIVEKNIKKVVVGCVDPYSKVAGKGIDILRRSGCNVMLDILHAESRELNKRFFTFHEKKRPYVILKWAQTADGFIDIHRVPDAEARPTWITSEKLRLLVHKWRAEEPAIMAGTNTALLDNPHLNIRDWQGKQPIRVILDRSCRLPASLHIFDNTQKTIIFNAKTDKTIDHTTWVKIPFDDSCLPCIMDHLHKMNMQSVFIEGGRQLLQSFIDQDLWDEARVFAGKQSFGNGFPAPVINNISPSQISLGNERFFFFKNPYHHNP